MRPARSASSLFGKDVANPMAMILAIGALLGFAAERGEPEASRASTAVYDAVMATSAAGVRTSDLGGHASTTEFTDAVIERVRKTLA